MTERRAPITLQDVARHAGVAPSTVSYVLSGKRVISTTTRQRVLSSIRVLGYHPHAGNDILAPEYSPIVAPFDGVAQADPNTLGGNAVTVRGAQGYVYNAHLVSYGKLGPVRTGDVIGYVGNSGDAAGGPYHDHFEWHPYQPPALLWRSPYGYTSIDDGTPAAVDPFPYLEAAC